MLKAHFTFKRIVIGVSNGHNSFFLIPEAEFSKGVCISKLFTRNQWAFFGEIFLFKLLNVIYSRRQLKLIDPKIEINATCFKDRL